MCECVYCTIQCEEHNTSYRNTHCLFESQIYILASRCHNVDTKRNEIKQYNRSSNPFPRGERTRRHTKWIWLSDSITRFNHCSVIIIYFPAFRLQGCRLKTKEIPTARRHATSSKDEETVQNSTGLTLQTSLEKTLERRRCRGIQLHHNPLSPNILWLSSHPLPSYLSSYLISIYWLIQSGTMNISIYIKGPIPLYMVRRHDSNTNVKLRTRRTTNSTTPNTTKPIQNTVIPTQLFPTNQIGLQEPSYHPNRSKSIISNFDQCVSRIFGNCQLSSDLWT